MVMMSKPQRLSKIRCSTHVLGSTPVASSGWWQPAQLLSGMRFVSAQPLQSPSAEDLHPLGTQRHDGLDVLYHLTQVNLLCHRLGARHRSICLHL